MAAHLTSRPTLSVCTFTADPPARVASSLALLREVADEIVVAVDDRLPVASLGPLVEVADRVVRAVWTGPLERELSWLHGLCTSEWTLRLDGDEVPSAALVDRLAGGGWWSDATHVFLPRRWVWGDAASMLDEAPWYPDLQLRLVRTLPGSPRFPTQVHEPMQVGGWGRVLAEPIYHLDLLVADEQARAAKAARYEALAPGLRAGGGVAQNAGFYLPERRLQAPAVVRIPQVDHERIGATLGGAGPALAPTSAVDLGPVVLPQDRAAAAPAPGDALVELVGTAPRRWTIGAAHTLVVRLTNRSAQDWRPDQVPEIRVGGQVLDPDGTVTAEFRQELPGPVPAGSNEVATLGISVPPGTGPHQLVVGLVREGVAWLDGAITLELVPTPPRRAVVTGGFSAFRHLGDDLIIRAVLAALAAELPELEVTLLAPSTDEAAVRFGVATADGAIPVLHRNRPAPVAVALRRLVALHRDAVRVRDGGRPRDPAHEPLLGVLAGASVVIAPGAGWLTSHFRLGQLLPRLAEVEAARVLGVPVLFESGTVGPLEGRLDRRLAGRLLQACTRISVRDGARSAALAIELGASPGAVQQVPDVATAAQAAPRPVLARWLADRGIDVDQPYAVVSVRDPSDTISTLDTDRTTAALVDALHALATAGVPAIFLPHCVDPSVDDRPPGRLLASRAPLYVDDEMPDDDVAVALVRSAAVTIGNRFHLALLSDGAGVPGVFLAATSFDALRSAAFTGGNVDVVEVARGGDPGAPAIERALARGAGTPAPCWDPAAFAAAVLDAQGVRR